MVSSSWASVSEFDIRFTTSDQQDLVLDGLMDME